MTLLGGNQSECRSPPLERIPENAARKLWELTFDICLTTLVPKQNGGEVNNCCGGFPGHTCPKRNNLIIHRDVNLIRRRATLFVGDIFLLECLFFSGNSINLLKTIQRLVKVSYVEIRLNHEHKSTPHKWLLIRLFS